MPVKGEGRLLSYPSKSENVGRSEMEEMVWEQHTVTIQRNSKMGFGIAVSGGCDNPNVESGETSIFVSDVLRGGPAEGLLIENDHVIQVNSVPMDNVPHSFAVQSLRKCGKVAKVTVKRPRKKDLKQPPSTDVKLREYTPSTHYYDADDISGYHEESWDHTSAGKGYLNPQHRTGWDYTQRGRSHENSQDRTSPGPGRSRRDRSGVRDIAKRESPECNPEHSYHMEDRYDEEEGIGRKGGRFRTSNQFNDNPMLEPLEKPLNVLLMKNRPTEEYGLRLGSQIFIKQMTSTGLAAKDGNLQEGDIILKINGTVTENLSLHDAGKLIERSRGKLQLVVQRDCRQILVRIPPLEDSDSDSDANMSYF
ncbi:tight junction protein ZO-2-like [Parambassis ranga]|uniref:Tight junction protein ZO-2-like n=1 Tax=Parambassis ranga TaxID=210632 RepID=A0A6P7J0I0_9TELE|nr:tight junction protein ZO-2-like [Parambassis ranga]